MHFFVSHDIIFCATLFYNEVKVSTEFEKRLISLLFLLMFHSLYFTYNALRQSVHQCRRINSPLLLVTTHKGQMFPKIACSGDKKNKVRTFFL